MNKKDIQEKIKMISYSMKDLSLVQYFFLLEIEDFAFVINDTQRNLCKL